MLDDVLGDRSSRSSRVMRWYSRANSRSSFFSCSSSSSAASSRSLHVLVQVLVGELELRDAVLVEERHGRAVLDRLLEVVDADVVAEDLPGLLLAHDQRRAGEGDEGGVGQGVRMFRASVSYWLRCASSVMTMMSDRSREHRVPLALLGAELLDQREDVAVILAEQPLEVLAALGLGLRPR